MDKESIDITSLRSELKPPPEESRFSTIVNGVLNGGTIAAAPLIAVDLFTSRELPNKKPIAIVATTIGCLIGGALGIREAERLQSYRQAMNNEISRIREQVNANNAAIKKWTQRQDEKKADPVVADGQSR
ncbi:MAG: hypothetical protein V4735_00490 [Pseudomonadota bacterium]